MRRVLITGANRGIGLAMTRLLCQRGDDVIAACRRSSPELEATGARVETHVDVSHPEDVVALADRLQDITFDWLLLNAGVLNTESLGHIDGKAVESILRQFEVNSLGPLLMASTFAQRVNSGGKIAITTSRMGSIADNTSGGYYGYRMSKAAVNAAGKSLANDLKPRDIAVFLLHPGFVQTKMVGGMGDITADEAAANIVARVDELGIEQTGTLWHAKGEPLPW